MKSPDIYTSPTAVLAEPALLNAAVEEYSYDGGTETVEDELLVQGCIQGDARSWERLIDKYKRLIYSIPIKYGASPDDAADVFQAVCIEALNSLPQLKNAQSLRSWLITLTIRQAYRWKKKQSHHVELDALEPEVAEAIACISQSDPLAQLEQEQIVQKQKDYGPPLCVLGLIDAALGDKEAALREGRRAMELMPVEKDSINGQTLMAYFAVIAAWAGEKDLALQQLVTVAPAPGATLITSYGVLKLLPFWEPLRGDPRFEAIVASLAPKQPAD